MVYPNRREAGKRLAAALKHFHDFNTVVLALPRGGVVLGFEVAKALSAPLGLVLVRKIGHPMSPEYAIGAVAEHDKPLYNTTELNALDLGWRTKAEATARKLIEARRDLYYSDDFIPPRTTNRIAIIVDDGIATGLTMEAAVRAVRHTQPKRVIVAAPVASAESIVRLRNVADEVIVLDNPSDFLSAVGVHYKSFNQVSDQEVKKLLREAEAYAAAHSKTS